MRSQRFLGFLIIAVILLCAESVLGDESSENPKDRSEVIARLERWPKDFSDKKVQEVCGLFAPDLIASYPGTVDRNYEEMCRQLTAAMTDSGKRFRYAEPKIEQILIEGDLAVVRLVWTLTITDKTGQSETVKEKGLDVFKRQKDGTWKIAISYAYPLSSNHL